MRRALLVPPLALLLCACPPTTGAMVEWALRDAGLPEPLARCVARNISDRTDQLALRQAASDLRLHRPRIQGASVAALLPQLAPLVASEVHAALAAAGAACGEAL